MALFGNKKADKAEEKQAPTNRKTAVPVMTERNLTTVLRRPRITEKAFAQSQQGVYTFEIDSQATKFDVIAAVKAVYDVTPKKVNIVRMRPRVVRSMMRKHASKQSGLKKAYVYLQAGDTISFM
jgi:large subunit ribosomal protein L23